MDVTLFAGIALDLVLFSILVVTALIGRKNGAIATLLRLCGGIAAAALSLCLAVWLTPAVCEKFTAPLMAKPIEQMLQTLGVDQLLASFQTWIEHLPASFGVWLSQETSLSGTFPTDDASLANSIASPIARALTAALIFLIAFVVFSALIALLVRAAKKFNRIPVLGRFNRFLGLLIGLLLGLVYAYALSAVFSLVFPTFCSLNVPFVSAVQRESTFLYRFLSGINPVTIVTDYFLFYHS